MAMRREAEAQDDLVVTWAEIPRSPGHVFYDKLQTLLKEGGFDAFVERICKPYYAARMGAPSLPPGRYFRLHMVGYFEGIDSERGIVWRCSDSYRCETSCGFRTGTRFPITPGCRRRAPDCRTRYTRKCSTGFWSWSPSAAW